MSAEARRCGILLPPGTEQSLAYKTYMEGCERMATEMTPQERAAYVYAKLGRGSVPDIKTIYEHTQQTRRAALLEQEELFKRIDAALTDWLRCYAPEEFTDEQLAETRKRLHGGTLAYIAYLRRDIKDAVTRLAQEG